MSSLTTKLNPDYVHAQLLQHIGRPGHGPAGRGCLTQRKWLVGLHPIDQLVGQVRLGPRFAGLLLVGGYFHLSGVHDLLPPRQAVPLVDAILQLSTHPIVKPSAVWATTQEFVAVAKDSGFVNLPISQPANALRTRTGIVDSSSRVGAP